MCSLHKLSPRWANYHSQSQYPNLSVLAEHALHFSQCRYVLFLLRAPGGELYHFRALLKSAQQ
jgi:hypothetical protein